jgi:hypothetical protein
MQVTGFDIPHAFPDDFTPVFGMDVRACVEYYQQRFSHQDWGAAADVAAQVGMCLLSHSLCSAVVCKSVLSVVTHS